MDNQPFISVLIPLYNHARDVVNCLDSIKAQTFTDYEVVIVNDGSTDNSKAVVTDYMSTHYRGGVFHCKPAK